MIKTITLTGDEVEVSGLTGTHAHLRNDGTSTIYVAKTAGITPGADGVGSVQAGKSYTLRGISGTIFLLGTGSVHIQSDDIVDSPFESSAASGGSGADDVARAAIGAHEADTDIHVTAADKAKWNGLSNPNMLDNPDFAVNQRGVSGRISAAGYFVDRWKLTNGTVTLNSDGTITLDGTIVQILEKAAGTDVVASASAGTASYDNATRTFTLTASGAKISWAKLEKGSVATAFAVPSPALELAKCQRYLLKINAFEAFRAVYVLPGYVDFSIPTPVTMRSGTISIDGDFSIYPFPIAAAVSGFTAVIQVYGQNQLRLRATKSNHGLTDAVLTIPDSKFMLLSNEL